MGLQMRGGMGVVERKGGRSRMGGWVLESNGVQRQVPPLNSAVE